MSTEKRGGYEVCIVDEPDEGWRSRRTLQVTRGGAVVLAESDGGEPEDQSFYRDWSWVEPALKAAYAYGLEDGQKAGLMPSAAHALCDTPMCVHPKGHRWRCADEDGRVCRPAGPSSSSALCPHCKGALP